MVKDQLAYYKFSVQIAKRTTKFEIQFQDRSHLIIKL